MNILSILDELAATSSTNAKVEILRREKDNEVLKRAFQAAYNPMIVYGVKQIPSHNKQPKSAFSMPLADALNQLNFLSTREKTGNTAIDLVRDVLESLATADSIVLERIIQRDLRCGTSGTLAARIWPGLVPTFDVMLAHKDISGIKFPAYAQSKEDGVRCMMYWDGHKAKAFSRNGKEFNLLDMFDDVFYTMKVPVGTVFDGELVCWKAGKQLDRKTSNGILNKANKGTISKEEAELVVMHCWDIVDFTGTAPYSERLKALNLYSGLNAKFQVLKTETINSEEEAQEFFQEMLALGKEGAVLKNIDSVWQPKRTKDLGKMKAEESVDLLVVDWYPGKAGTKYEDGIGGLVCQTSDGLIEVRVGSGLSDEQRFENPNDWVGKIVEVQYNMRIKAKGDKKESLFLPRLITLRTDKDVANTIDEVK